MTEFNEALGERIEAEVRPEGAPDITAGQTEADILDRIRFSRTGESGVYEGPVRGSETAPAEFVHNNADDRPSEGEAPETHDELQEPAPIAPQSIELANQAQEALHTEINAIAGGLKAELGQISTQYQQLQAHAQRAQQLRAEGDTHTANTLELEVQRAAQHLEARYGQLQQTAATAESNAAAQQLELEQAKLSRQMAERGIEWNDSLRAEVRQKLLDAGYSEEQLLRATARDVAMVVDMIKPTKTGRKLQPLRVRKPGTKTGAVATDVDKLAAERNLRPTSLEYGALRMQARRESRGEPAKPPKARRARSGGAFDSGHPADSLQHAVARLRAGRG